MRAGKAFLHIYKQAASFEEGRHSWLAVQRFDAWQMASGK